jgi:predicted transcriptional regulator
MEKQSIIELAADIVVAHVSNNTVAVGDLPNLIQNVHGALASLGAPPAIQAEERKPAVSVRSSVKPDYIVCLECGAKQKMLKRHLTTSHGLTPDQYRQEFGLPKTYPLVAPNYAETRRALAHKIGLGRKPKKANGSAQPKRSSKASTPKELNTPEPVS